ncbi:MAG: MotA/TolQ/ExbB proton channel family protein [Sedimentisphaerales bacterium]|nr:MotA/TolQ/ExbB proton channel family protein [Sedimentisphaerales bacterium]
MGAAKRFPDGGRRIGRSPLWLLAWCALFLAMPSTVWAQDGADANQTPKPATQPAGGSTLSQVEVSVQQQLETSLAELAALREQIAKEKIPLSQRLNDLEDQLLDVRHEYQQTARLLDSRTLDLSNLRSEIQSRREEKTYLSNLLGEYIRNFETRLHIAEMQRYRTTIEAATLAAENSNLTEAEVYQAQAAVVTTSLDRLDEALGGVRFEGTAVDISGLLKRGTFVLIGPAAIFRSQDGQTIGTVEQRLGSLEPTVIGFESQAMAQAAAETIATASGRFPLDPTLGNAHKIEATKETLREHIVKGGPVMVPILGLAAAALLVAILKWLQLARVRNPSEKRIRTLLQAVAEHDEKLTLKAKAVGGPVGQMLLAGAEHVEEPPELVEEVMYERILATKLRLQRLLPFIAISASSAPLLGLLGTVTGIINTFKLITVYGSGDVKTLSSGISEALITTEFGLIVAIPSLLIHALLSRKARGIVDRMEKAATSFINQVSKTPYRQDDTVALLADMPAAVAREVLRTLDPRGGRQIRRLSTCSENSAGGIMDPVVVSVNEAATVADVIATIRAAATDGDLQTIFVVDRQGKYVGGVPVHRLLTRPEQTRIGSMVDANALSVHVDDDRDDVRILFSRPEVSTLPVLDHQGHLVGHIPRNGD